MEDKLRHQASYHTSLRVSTQHFTFSFIICTISSPTVRGTHVVRAFNCLTQTTTARAECSPPQTPQVSLHTVMDVHCWWKKTVTRGLKTLQREITWRSWNWVIVFWQNYQGHIHKTTLFWDGEKVKIGTESTSNYGLGIVPSVLVLQAFTHYNKWGCKKCQQSFSCAWQLMACACLDEGGLIRACAV